MGIEHVADGKLVKARWSLSEGVRVLMEWGWRSAKVAVGVGVGLENGRAVPKIGMQVQI